MRTSDQPSVDPHGTAPDRSTRSTRPATVLALLTTTAATCLLALAGWFGYQSARSQADLAGLGYVLAAVLAAPALVGLALAGTGFVVRHRHRTAAQALTATGLVVTLLPPVFLASVFAVF